AIKEGKVRLAEREAEVSRAMYEEMKQRYETRLALWKNNKSASEEEVREAKLGMEKYMQEALAKREAIKIAELELKQAKTILEMPEIRALAAGVVQDIYKKAGEGVMTLEVVFRIRIDAKKKKTSPLNGGPGGKQAEIEVLRPRRVLRWRMKFNTVRGDEYRGQLGSLGAIVGIPAGDGKYEGLRKLRPPAQGKVEDLEKIKRISWIDDTPQSLKSLSQALKLPAQPAHIVTFFPIEFEEKLAQLEKNYRGRKEEEIKETRFEIRRLGK